MVTNGDKLLHMFGPSQWSKNKLTGMRIYTPGDVIIIIHWYVCPATYSCAHMHIHVNQRCAKAMALEEMKACRDEKESRQDILWSTALSIAE